MNLRSLRSILAITVLAAGSAVAASAQSVETASPASDAPAAQPVARVTIDYTFMLRELKPFHLNHLDKAVGLDADQRARASTILDNEADKVAALLAEYSKTRDFHAAMLAYARIQMGSVQALRTLLTTEQFSKLRPVIEDRRVEVINIVTSEINSDWYEAATEAKLLPKQ